MLKKIVSVFLWINHKLLLRFQSILMLAAIYGILLLILITIIARNILHQDIFAGAEEILTLMSAWMYFMGGSLASHENSHITADLISASLKTERSRAIHQIYVSCVTVFGLGILAFWAYKWILRTIHYGGVSSIYNYPLVFMYLPVLICLVLSCVYFVGHGLKAALRLTKMNDGKD